MKRNVTLELGEFTLDALAGDGRGEMDCAQARVVRAVRYYLKDSDSGRAEWPCPDFLRDKPDGGGEAVELSVDEGLWDSLEQEAARQGIPAPRLAEHAALYFVADRDAGRVTQRILDDLGD